MTEGDPKLDRLTRHASAPTRPRRASLSFGSALAMVLCFATAAVTCASAAPPIERVWSFNGGEVAIQSEPSGTFTGTVVVPTKFAQCTHPVGEAMWTGMLAQPDGSYWGRHQWYFETAPCTPDEQPGPTAWRVMTAPSGDSYLLVCFDTPGGAQPTIAAGGAVTNVGYGCVRSAEIAPVAQALAFSSAVSLPSDSRCLSRRSFKIHLHQYRYDPFKQVIVSLRGRRLVVQRHGNVFAATIDLHGLPRGAFTVRIRITTVLGHRITGARTFHTCKRKATKVVARRGSRPAAVGAL
jgi:hypothetical protein